VTEVEVIVGCVVGIPIWFMLCCGCCVCCLCGRRRNKQKPAFLKNDVADGRLVTINIMAQDGTLRVSDPLEEGKVFYFYSVCWKEAPPPGLYQLAMVAKDQVGRVVAIQSVAKDADGDPMHWGIFYNPPRYRPLLCCRPRDRGIDKSGSVAERQGSAVELPPPPHLVVEGGTVIGPLQQLLSETHVGVFESNQLTPHIEDLDGETAYPSGSADSHDGDADAARKPAKEAAIKAKQKALEAEKTKAAAEAARKEAEALLVRKRAEEAAARKAEADAAAAAEKARRDAEAAAAETAAKEAARKEAEMEAAAMAERARREAEAAAAMKSAEEAARNEAEAAAAASREAARKEAEAAKAAKEATEKAQKQAAEEVARRKAEAAAVAKAAEEQALREAEEAAKAAEEAARKKAEAGAARQAAEEKARKQAEAEAAAAAAAARREAEARAAEEAARKKAEEAAVVEAARKEAERVAAAKAAEEATAKREAEKAANAAKEKARTEAEEALSKQAKEAAAAEAELATGNTPASEPDITGGITRAGSHVRPPPPEVSPPSTAGSDLQPVEHDEDRWPDPGGPKTPTERLMVGDLLISVDETEVSGNVHGTALLRGAVGEIRLSVRRSGALLTTTVYKADIQHRLGITLTSDDYVNQHPYVHRLETTFSEPAFSPRQAPVLDTIQPPSLDSKTLQQPPEIAPLLPTGIEESDSMPPGVQVLPPDVEWVPLSLPPFEDLAESVSAKVYQVQEAIFDRVDVMSGMASSLLGRGREKVMPSDELAAAGTEETVPSAAPTATWQAPLGAMSLSAAVPTTSPPAAEPSASPAVAAPRKKKKTQAERMAELSAPRIRDDRIKPGMHVYKPPVRGLAYRGTEKMAMYQDRRDGGTTYKHREQNEQGDCKLRLRETQGNEKVVLKNGEAEGLARQRAIESATGIGNCSFDGSAASKCHSAAGPSAPSRPGSSRHAVNQFAGPGGTSRTSSSLQHNLTSSTPAPKRTKVAPARPKAKQ